jgi:hypothetical protein
MRGKRASRQARHSALAQHGGTPKRWHRDVSERDDTDCRGNGKDIHAAVLAAVKKRKAASKIAKKGDVSEEGRKRKKGDVAN